jgi:uncharacterized protein
VTATPEPRGLDAALARLSAVQEAVLVWAFCFATVVIAYVAYTPSAKIVATIGFLYVPPMVMRRRNEDYREYGVTLRRWRDDLKVFALVCAVVLPPYVLGYAFFAEAINHLPPSIAELVSPYRGSWHFQPRLPDRFGEWVVDQTLVVALPEEFFYRGFLMQRLRDAFPRGRLFLGVRLGPAFWLTALLFALGHLAIFRPWRLAVFFPALIFAWMKERTGSIAGAVAFHALCNLLEKVLYASFYGGP